MTFHKFIIFETTIIFTTMNIHIKKLNLIERLMLLHDESVINKIEKLLQTASKSKPTSIEPMTLDEYYSRIEASEKAIREGNIIS